MNYDSWRELECFSQNECLLCKQSAFAASCVKIQGAPSPFYLQTSIMAVTRSKDKVWLLRGTLDCFSTAKLSSRDEVLKVLFDFYRKKRLDLNTSVNKTISLLLPAWSLSSKSCYHSSERTSIHQEWQNLKSINRKNAREFIKRSDFQFNISHRDAFGILD